MDVAAMRRARREGARELGHDNGAARKRSYEQHIRDERVEPCLRVDHGAQQSRVVVVGALACRAGRTLLQEPQLPAGRRAQPSCFAIRPSA